MSQKRDYYEVLGVNRKASDSDLKKAFRSKAREFHPDKNPDDPEAEARFKEVQEAYAILSNPDERRKYDMFGHDAPGGGAIGPGGDVGVKKKFDEILNGGGYENILYKFFRVPTPTNPPPITTALAFVFILKKFYYKDIHNSRHDYSKKTPHEVIVRRFKFNLIILPFSYFSRIRIK